MASRRGGEEVLGAACSLVWRGHGQPRDLVDMSCQPRGHAHSHVAIGSRVECHFRIMQFVTKLESLHQWSRTGKLLVVIEDLQRLHVDDFIEAEASRCDP